MGSARLTWDMASTIITETECLVDARPLTHVRSDNEDEHLLTPNHLLIGGAFPNIPDCVFNENSSWKTKTSDRTTGGNMEEIGPRILAYSERPKERDQSRIKA